MIFWLLHISLCSIHIYIHGIIQRILGEIRLPVHIHLWRVAHLIADLVSLNELRTGEPRSLRFLQRLERTYLFRGHSSLRPKVAKEPLKTRFQGPNYPQCVHF